MAHFAEVENGIVKRVVAAPTQEWCVENLGGEWIQTSYNTFGGVHYGADGKPDEIEPLHKNYAGPGYLWDGIGFCQPQPYPSWTLNSESYLWEPPVPRPEVIEGSGKDYLWDEETLSWKEVDLA